MSCSCCLAVRFPETPLFIDRNTQFAVYPLQWLMDYSSCEQQLPEMLNCLMNCLLELLVLQ